ncbi:MAG: CpsD/CapB family tyrosine-protein kinase [Planctomycetes bacterium]|nr:CpsD/CapB family tyrosine-protein kinase [Planctomycetota bacterium]
MTDVMKKVQETAATGDSELTDVEAAPAAGRAVDTGFIAGESSPTPPAVPWQAEPEFEAGAAPIAVSDEIQQWPSQRIDPAVIAFHDRQSAICEQYRSVHARLLSMNTAQAHQVIAITSAVPQEGKSVTTLNLGLVMAEGGEHTILIADADFRRTSIARMLGTEGKPGLAELLRNEVELADVLYPTPFPNLKIVPAGMMKDRNYAELLSTPLTRGVLAQFRATFDYTFLDTPPITTVSDVSMLAPHCDGSIVVIEMRRTPEPTVQQAVRTLQTNNVKVLGCILSRYRDRRSRYYDRYYSYYHRD